MGTENPKREQPNTYFVQDQSSKQERERVRLQGEMLTMMMGGVLPEQPDATIFREVLDIGCGSGEWLIEAAQKYPTMSRLVGVDVNVKMIEYARARAQGQGVADRVEFHVMDVLRQLNFPDDSFDLVNQRLGSSYLRVWDWPGILQKYQRVVRPEGVVRVIECGTPQGNSPAFSQLSDLFATTLFKAGNLKTEHRNGPLDFIPPLFEQQGFRNLQTRAYHLLYPADTPEGKLYAEDIKYGFRTLLPFFHKWTRVPDNYDEIYQQALIEIYRPDFVGTWDFLTIWGNPPTPKVKTQSRH